VGTRYRRRELVLVKIFLRIFIVAQFVARLLESQIVVGHRTVVQTQDGPRNNFNALPRPSG